MPRMPEKTAVLPRISLVTVSFNQGRFLEAAIRSALSQEYLNLEYIVADGGSGDGSAEIIRRHESRLAWSVSEPDRGPAHALNKAFARATGELFGYLNSDDVLQPGALAAAAALFLRRPETDVVYGDVDYIDEKGRPAAFPGKRTRQMRTVAFDRLAMLRGVMPVPQQGSLWRAAVHRKIGGFNEENRTCWDGEFFYRCALAGFRFHHLPRSLGGFRIHSGSISGSGNNREAYRQDCRRLRQLGRDSGFSINFLYTYLSYCRIQLRRTARYLSGRRPASGRASL